MTEATELGWTTNSYVLIAKLASGGMADIFIAHAASAAGIERYVVLKRVLQHRAANPNAAKMFLDEARLSAQLQHANIAQVHDIGTAGNALFFTMEYVHGVTLSELVRVTKASGSAIPIACVLTTIAGAAAGLHYAHEKHGLDGKPLGIVHRDVSPSNLMLTYEGTLKIVDFGIAKASRRLTDTQAGTIKGKLSYMSPEQCRGLELDRRSDLFSLGIVMWEMLTGSRLFKRETEYEHMERIVFEKTAPPSDLRPEVSPELDAIVMKLLAKAPGDRYQTAEELLEAIEDIAVRSGSALSTTTLGRFVREQCGRRAEPWLETRNPTNREVLTVSTLPSRVESLDTTVTDQVPQEDPIAQAATASYSYGAVTAPAPPRAPPGHGPWWWPVAAACAGVVVWLVWPRPTTTSSDSSPVPPVSSVAQLSSGAPADATLPDAGLAVEVADAADEAPRSDGGDPIGTAFAAHRYADVFAICDAGTITGDAAELCVIAACNLRDVASARQWLAQVKLERRASSMAACKSASVRPSARPRAKTEAHAATPDAGVERPRAKRGADCTADPLACQF